jgi:hypothetical protein
MDQPSHAHRFEESQEAQSNVTNPLDHAQVTMKTTEPPSQYGCLMLDREVTTLLFGSSTPSLDSKSLRE